MKDSIKLTRVPEYSYILGNEMLRVLVSMASPPWSSYEEMMNFYNKQHPEIFDTYVKLGIFCK